MTTAWIGRKGRQDRRTARVQVNRQPLAATVGRGGEPPVFQHVVQSEPGRHRDARVQRQPLVAQRLQRLSAERVEHHLPLGKLGAGAAVVVDQQHVPRGPASRT